MDKELDNSVSIQEYKKLMYEQVKLVRPDVSYQDIEPVLNYSIEKRYKEAQCKIVNTYTHREVDMTLLGTTDYIKNKKPIVTAYGTLFSRNDSDVVNLLRDVVDGFLGDRSKYKKKMFQYDKGTELFNYYNLQQMLTKQDTNAIYGTLGMYTCLIYNVNVATSITSQGRSLVSSMTMFFEQFLSNNAKFGSVDQVLNFINNIVKERPYRKFDDKVVLDDLYISPEDCFQRLVLSCGYRWIPNPEELEIIWQAVNNLSWEDRNRVYYKNNLYAFASNSYVVNIIKDIMRNLREPFLCADKAPENVVPQLDLLVDLMREYVYYRYMVIDRIDRCDNMIKNVTIVSDTDSTIVSLDAWYQFCKDLVKDENLFVRTYRENPIFELKRDEFGDLDDSDKASRDWTNPLYEIDPQYDYDFVKDELIDLPYSENPLHDSQDNIRLSSINILAYVLDRLVNDYMEKYCENNNSFEKGGPRKCRIIAKNEFTFTRLLMTEVKKNYASLQAVQEGNIVPEDQQLDIKGIASMKKSSMSKSTRDALQKVLYEDILKADKIDQLKIIKHIAILEKQINESLRSGSREFYKPVKIKASSTYQDPMRIQGVKAATVWNILRDPELPAINLDERNAIDVAKIKTDKATMDYIEQKYPDVFERYKELIRIEPFCKKLKGNTDIVYGIVDAIAIPLDISIPDWLIDMVDFATIINDNIGGFVYESVGIKRFNKSSINYTNILQL